MGVFKSLTGCALILALVATQARADVITPVSVTPSTQFAAAVNTINGSGLDGVGPILGQLHDNDENHMWQTFAASSVGEFAIFELDQVYDLNAAHIWQYNGPAATEPPLFTPWREVEDFDISISPDLVAPFVSLGTNTLNPALDPLSGPIPDFNEPVQSFGLGGSNLARRVKITILSIYDPTNGDGAAGLSEVRFGTIPEPTTLGLAAMSLLSLPWLTRRRRRDRA
jgi:hypothetical protein